MKNIKRIFSIGLGIALIAVSTVATAKDSTGLSPPTPKPGDIMVLDRGVTNWIYGNSTSGTVAKFNTTTQKCPANSSPKLQVALLKNYYGNTSSTYTYTYISDNATIDPSTYQASLADARVIKDTADDQIQLSWVMLCIPN